MIISKFLAIGMVIFTLGAALGLVWKARENAELRVAIARRSAPADPRVAVLERQITLQSQRLNAAETKVAGLLSSAKQTSSALASASAAAAAPVSTEEAAKVALAKAAQLIKEDKRQEALDEYVKCYRELQAVRPGSSECQRLMSAIQHLSRTYPAARIALASLRDAALAEWQAKPDRRELPFEIALLNERLGDGVRTLAVYDSLPSNDSMGRQSLAMIAFSAFVEARRYPDALRGKSSGQMLSALEAGTQQIGSVDPAHQAGMRKAMIDQALANIEVLTGAGKTEEARLLTEKLLAFDGTDATRVGLQQHVDRAQLAKP